eukprot:1713844-Rhodomonas_salina.1
MRAAGEGVRAGCSGLAGLCGQVLPPFLAAAVPNKAAVLLFLAAVLPFMAAEVLIRALVSCIYADVGPECLLRHQTRGKPATSRRKRGVSEIFCLLYTSPSPRDRG